MRFDGPRLRCGHFRHTNYHLIDDGSNSVVRLEQPLPCKQFGGIVELQSDYSNRLEQAAAPEDLAQETIIDNLAPEEAQRLSRVRNIGIAVRSTLLYLGRIY